MILPLLLAAVQAPPAQHDVVVAALHRLRIATQVEGGKVKACQARVSSGDAEIDRTACEATVACFNGGVTQPEPLADCVEVKVAAFVRKRDGQ
ncbi:MULTISPECIES: hypothetical protein [unclassified Sphingomonas]|uniref:hypothetical protein n=1 Tax=unclassified Sphingomonas TaxID=196159 RepID=UPI000927CED3|nr:MULTISPECIES: hypothetical protein [unclassified Sphingomonas]MBN8848846.1 hypothetical protein [Sphingomonas sp.]OJV32858.1 MAG: hypothetical protein BGO24_07045 [Sphingomonas sp. 67-36]